MKLVYTYALGAYTERCGGSSPLSGTFLLHLSMWWLLFLCLAKPVFAQSNADLYTQYRTDYFYERDNYQRDYLDYQNKKDTYNQYKTVTAQNDKVTATKTVFLSQNAMLRAYLMALRTTLDDYQGNQSELLKLEEWLSTQNTLIPNLNSPAALQNWATTFKAQYVSIQKELYTALVQAQINRRLKTLNNIKKLADSAKVEWSASFSDKENKIYSNYQIALKTTQKSQRTDVYSDFYSEAKSILDQSDTIIRSLISDLKSIIIKNNQ